MEFSNTSPFPENAPAGAEVLTPPSEPTAAPEPEPSGAQAIPKTKRRAPRKKNKLAKKVQKYFEAKEAGRVAYAQADRLLDEISGEVKPGTEIQLYDKKGDPVRPVRFVDLFAEKNVVFKPCGVRRYDLVIVK
jgi:hypothetical protein